MANTELIQAIKAEIERQRKFIEGMFIEGDNNFYDGQDDAYNNVLSFLSTLESEKPINLDDAMKELNEKIALVKQRGTWDGVDVDKYMDEVRGREPEKQNQDELEKEIDRYFLPLHPVDIQEEPFTQMDKCARHFAKWGAEHTPLPEDTVLFNKGVEEGKRLMMEDAVKWLVDDDYHEATEKGRFILGSVGIGYNGYYIPYSDLLKLPKEGEEK